MVGNKYKHRSGFLTWLGIIVMALAPLVYYFTEPIYGLDALKFNSVIFGFGLATLMMSQLFLSEAEGKIQQLEKALEQKNP